MPETGLGAEMTALPVGYRLVRGRGVYLSFRGRRGRVIENLEDLKTEFTRLKERSQEARWAQGDLIIWARARWGGRGLTSSIAQALACSVRHVQDLERTAQAFRPSARARDMAWEIHRLAATTDKPGYWMDQAVGHQYSTRQLSRAIKAGGDQGPTQASAAAEMDAIIRDVEAFAARWGSGGQAELERLAGLVAQLAAAPPARAGGAGP